MARQQGLGINDNAIIEVSVGIALADSCRADCAVFYLGDTQMKALIVWYDKADRLVKEAGAIQKDIASRILACPTLETQMEFVATSVAPAIAKRYKSKVVRTRTGGVSFNKADGTRDSTALSALRYWCARTTLFAPSGSAARKDKPRFKTDDKTVWQRDFVLKAFKLLSVADRKWVIKHAGI